MKKLIETSDEFKQIEEEWYKEIDTLTTKSKFNAFVNKLNTGYEHDFGTSLRAIACIVNATIRFYGGGLTPIQANYLMWQIIRKTFGYNDKIGLQLIQYERLLYEDLQLEIDNNQHETLIDTAKINLEKYPMTTELEKRWKKIAKGWLPKDVHIKGEEEGEA